MDIIHPRHANILIVGAIPDQDHWQRYKSQIKSGLQGMHMGWSVVTNFADSIDDAITKIDRNPELRLVLILNEASQHYSQMEKDVARIAQSLIRHPAKPWVLLNSDLEYLEPVFQQADVKVEAGSMYEDIIFRRWVADCDAVAA